MKSLIITTTLMLSVIFASADDQHKKVTKITREFPLYHGFGNMAIPSPEQVKSVDSLKKAGYHVLDVYRVTGTVKIRVVFIKY